MKKPQLFASGIVFLGFGFLATGIYLSAAKSSETTSSISETPQIISTPQQNASAKTPKPVAAKSAFPTPAYAPTPEPPNPTKIEWASKDSYLGHNRWRVFLSSEKWFDTGIPYITNDTLNTEKNDSNTILFKINGEEINIKGNKQIYFFDRDGFSPSLRDTVKIKLEKGSEPASFELILGHVNAICPDHQNHKEIHEASIAWAEKMIAKTK